MSKGDGTAVTTWNGPVNKFARKVVKRYSVRNRRRKADSILEWMAQRNIHNVLLVGTTGEGHTDPHLDIIERRIGDRYRVKMGINIEPVTTSQPFQVADVRDLPFENDYVDFAVANAIIEHVGGEPEQRTMVEEMTRVARSWVITTPNRWFPVEAHTGMLFLHWVPRWRQTHEMWCTRLLSRRELRELLPAGAEIVGRPWNSTFTARYSRIG
jgi:hypothetical protein